MSSIGMRVRLSEGEQPERPRDRMKDIERQLNNYRLTTAEILYHMPDNQEVLQTFIWQDYDIAPGFPRLHRFLDFWDRNLDGKVHSVRVVHVPLIKPPDYRHAGAEFWLQ